MNLETIYQLLSTIDGIKYAWRISKRYILPQTIQSFINANITASGQQYGYSLKEIEMIIKKEPPSLFKSDKDAIVFGYIQTLKMIFKDYQALIFEETLVRKLHEKILRYSNIDLYKKGQYNFNSANSPQNIMGIFMGKQAVPAAQQEIKKAIENYHQSSEHSVLKIAKFIQTFLDLSPFREGNAQVADILIALLMLQEGYEFIKWSPLQPQKESFNLDNFLNEIKNQALSSIEVMNQDTIEHLLSPKQTLLWEWACQNKSQEFSRKDAVEALNFPERTVEEIIKKLTLMKRFIRIGQGKATRYKVV